MEWSTSAIVVWIARTGLCLLPLWSAHAAAAPEMILHHGRILTVDQQFTTVEALAIEAGRIRQVGSSEQMLALADGHTRRIDLQGKTVVPGLIDNHVHIMRAAPHWPHQLRFEGVESRSEAVALITNRVRSAAKGEWIAVLGGWTEDQFADHPRGFSRSELDVIAPDNPVVIRRSFTPAYVNTAALHAIGVREWEDLPWSPLAEHIELDEQGVPTGKVWGPVHRKMEALLPHAEGDAGARAIVADFNRVGLTAVLDVTGPGKRPQHYAPFRRLAEAGALNLRVFHTIAPTAIAEAASPEALYKELTATAFRPGDAYFAPLGVGEIFYRPMHDSMQVRASASVDDVAMMAQYAERTAAAGIYLHFHATQEASIAQSLAIFEVIDRWHDLERLRWTFAHADGITDASLQRVKALGMGLALHSRPVIAGKLEHRDSEPMLIFGTPPLRSAQASGVTWGLGSDATNVGVYNPFLTLWWAVTGKMLDGSTISEQTVTRQEALIAHTRGNAYLLFQEERLGSLEPGKLADLVVLDRDYLRIPADEIREIRPLLTMVGGEVVYADGAYQAELSDP